MVHRKSTFGEIFGTVAAVCSATETFCLFQIAATAWVAAL